MRSQPHRPVTVPREQPPISPLLARPSLLDPRGLLRVNRTHNRRRGPNAHFQWNDHVGISSSKPSDAAGFGISSFVQVAPATFGALSTPDIVLLRAVTGVCRD